MYPPRNTHHHASPVPQHPGYAGYIPLLIFVAALLPRLYALGRFLTIDEVKWAEGAGQFLLALSGGHLAQTYWHFHPGITLTWGAAAALWGLCQSAPDLAACTASAVANLPATIGWLRLSPVLLTSLSVAGVYLLAHRLLGRRVALATALLLAFDPFFLAHSRILNGDALAAVLMFLSLLAFLIYRRSTPSFLILSAVLAGLALLTKLPAPVIGLFIGGLGLVFLAIDQVKGRRLAVRLWLTALATWGLVALLVFVILWPAMWVAPRQTLHQMYVDAFEVGQVGAGHDAFFRGQIVTDPGPWFYPYAVALRLTPITGLGLLAVAGWLLLPVAYVGLKLAHYFIHPWPGRWTAATARLLAAASRLALRLARQVTFNRRQALTALVMLVYIAGIILLANASPKKLDRYVMGVVPPIILLAALGLDAAARLVQPAIRRFSAWFIPLMAAGQLLFAVLASPYYLTYYNPLLGGPAQAAATAPVGWGEGLEQAAAYLNSRPNAGGLAASSWYSDIFQPYFAGRKASFSDDGRSQLAADYVVFYVNQIQRQKPYPELVNYFRRGTPEFVVAVTPTGGIIATTNVTAAAGLPRWVEVYRSPAAQSAGGAPKIEGVAQLLAYKVDGNRDAVILTLFLRALGPLPPESVIVAGLTQEASPGAQYTAQYPEISGNWQTGNIIEWRGQLAAPPGEYRLRAGLQDNAGRTLAEFEISPKDPPVKIE